MESRFFARSASDNTDDWPFWFVADRVRGGLNVTNDLLKKVDPEYQGGCVLVSRPYAEKLAEVGNTPAPKKADQ